MMKKKAIVIGSFVLGAVIGAMVVKSRSKKCNCCKRDCEGDNVDYVCDCTADVETEVKEGENENE